MVTTAQFALMPSPEVASEADEVCRAMRDSLPLWAGVIDLAMERGGLSEDEIVGELDISGMTLDRWRSGEDALHPLARDEVVGILEGMVRTRLGSTRGRTTSPR